MKKVYVILVALDYVNFNHCWNYPQACYDNYEDAEQEMEKLIHLKKFEQQQLEIQKLWMITENN